MHKWPAAVINHMMWRQRELEDLPEGGKSEVPTETSVDVYVLWNTHQV